VMMARSIEIARRYGVPLHVRASYSDAEGTWIGEEGDLVLEKAIVSGVTHDISFTLPKTDLATAKPILDRLAQEIGASSVDLDDDVAKVSLVGAGMRSHPGVAADMFEALAEAGINIEIISTSSIRVSCVVRASEVEEAVRAVHAKFRLFAEERVNA